MAIGMQIENLKQRLEEIDRLMEKEEVPIPQRPIKAFVSLLEEERTTVDLFGSFSTPLLDEIHNWYRRRYGDRVLVDFSIGRKPILLRGLVYWLRFPTVYGTAALNPLKYVEGLTSDMAKTLSPVEQSYITESYMNGYYQFASLANLRSQLGSVKQAARELAERGLGDISAAVSVLKTSGDSQLTVFHSQQAAEKFMKAALAKYGFSPTQLKKLGHDLVQALDALKSRDSKFEYIEAAARKVNLPSMEVRYSNVGFRSHDAIESLDCALHICSFITNQWQLDEERKGEAPMLVPGKFYANSLGLKYRCIAVERDGDGNDVARMALLDNHGIDAVLKQKAKYAFFYVEIKDTRETERLEQRYQTVIVASQERGRSHPTKRLSFAR